jgi:uncharacterized membrane protein
MEEVLMQSIFRFVVAGLIGAVLFVSSAIRADAANQSSRPSQGETQMDQTFSRIEKTLQSPPKSLEAVTQRSNQGLNEVQGSADANKMESSNQKGPAIKQELEKALERVTK